MRRGLGTQLRHLIELLDGAVAEEYAQQKLNYRPRYTPVMRALAAQKSLSITEIALMAGTTQPAATQTITLMIQDCLLEAETNSQDKRAKVVHMTKSGRDLLPQLEACWAAVTDAADGLDADLPFPLSVLLELAIDALEKKPFALRIHAARGAWASVPHF